MVVRALSMALLLVTLPAGPPSRAATLPRPGPFTALAWQSIGPLRGGRSIAVAGAEARPFEDHFGATGGGLWKTADGGTTWHPVTDGQIASSSVGAVAVAPSNPDVVYIGMGESALRGNAMQGDGVYRSTDAGGTWQRAGLAETLTISRLVVHPTRPETVYAAALGDPSGPSPARGIYRTRDGGQTWDRVLFRDGETGAVDLAMDPRHPSVLYAALWQVTRVPWRLWSGGPGSGLFKTTDGGDTWTEITRAPGFAGGVIGRIGVAVSGADSSRLCAVVEAKDGGLYRSDDAGASWALVNPSRDLWQRSFYFNRVTADPVNRDLVYVLNFDIARSTDAGRTYTLNAGAHVDYHDLWIDPANPLRLIAANDGGGAVSVNGGATWTEQRFPTGQMYRVETTADFPYHVVACQQDNSSVAVPSNQEAALGLPGSQQGSFFYEVGGGESGWVAPHPAKPDIVFAGSTNALTRYDRATNQLTDVQPWPRTVMGEPAQDMPERWNWTYPIVFSPLPPYDLYVASQHVWRSRDEGRTWDRISGDLTRADPDTLGDTGGPIVLDEDGPEVYATVFALAPSRIERDTIWAGSDDGVVHVTRDGGRTWRDVTPAALAAHTRISAIDASPHAAGRAFVAARRNQLGDRQPYLFRTDDFGATWSRIDASLPRDDFTHAIREDPVRPGLLYAGTEHGAYVSFDAGASWQSLALNLPDVQVSDIKVERHDLVIATHGRGFWVLPALEPLRQWQPRAGHGTFRLFRPAGVVRTARPARIDLLADEALNGASIDILDVTGHVLRRLRVPTTLSAGHHRLTWDLRTQGATVFPGMVLEAPNPAAGVVVPPGEYEVRLTAGGTTEAERFTVEADPRSTGVSEDDYAAQYALALRLRDATSAANEAVLRIREAKARLSATPGQGPATEALSAIEAALYQVKNRSPKDKIAFPIRLNDRLAGLLAIVETGDDAPTAADRQVADELIAELDAHLARLERVLRDAGRQK